MGNSGHCGRLGIWGRGCPGWGYKPVRWAFLGLLTGGCVVPQADCYTECGMAVRGATDCERLSWFEAEGIEAFFYLYEPLCDRLDAVSMQVVNAPDGKWTDDYGRTVAGLTFCDLSLVQIADNKYETNAYFHELAHVAQCPFQDVAHETWKGLGIWDKLDALRTSSVEFYKVGPDYLGDADAP